MKKYILPFALSALVVSVGFAQDTVRVKPSPVVQLDPNKPKPLFILDEVELAGSDLGKLEPKDIETIEVIKDAKSIEKYGEKGKNGVVIITTRKFKQKKTKAGT